MVSKKHKAGILIVIAAAAITAIIAVVLWSGVLSKQTGADHMVNSINSMYSNVVFHDAAEYKGYRISAFTCGEDQLGGYLIDNEGFGSGGAGDDSECMVMFASDFDTGERIIGVVDRGNAARMDFREVYFSDDGTSTTDSSQTFEFELDKKGVSAYLFTVPQTYQKNCKLIYTIYDKDGNVLRETAEQ